VRERERGESWLASLWLVLFRLGSQMASFGLDSSVLLALKLILEWGFSIDYSRLEYLSDLESQQFFTKLSANVREFP
jgi:hypothetical protein